MTKRTIRVLCVDDHEFLGEGLRTRLGLEADLEFVGWVESADAMLAAVARATPDVVLLDIEMPGSDPFDVLATLVARHPDVRPIMLSAYVKDQLIDAALKAGAWGYLSKSDAPEAVVEAIRKVREGSFAFGPQVLARCEPARDGAGAGAGKPASRLETLTQRERQILRLIGKGLSRQEIAQAIHRSPKTVDNHRAAIMGKLDLHDRVELARYAIREGLTEP